MAEYDAIVIGAGHNGLLLGGYLAKSGMSVVIFERNYEPAVGLSTLEITKTGFLHNVHSCFHGCNPWAPAFVDLEFEKYGLKYIYPDVQHAIPYSDGKCLLAYNYELYEKTYKSVQRISPKDADTWLKWRNALDKVRDEFIWVTHYVSPSKLSGDEVDKVYDKIPLWNPSYFEMSQHELFSEIFEDDRIVGWADYVSLIFGYPIDVKGMGAVAPNFFTYDVPWGLVVGGSHQLAHAESAVLHAYGGILYEGMEVTKINIEDGKATGVTLADGREVKATKVVASNLNPHLNLKLIGEENFDSEIVKKLKAFKYRSYTLHGVYMASNEAPKYTSANWDKEINRGWDIGVGAESGELVMDQVKQIRDKKIPWNNLWGTYWCNTLFDESQAPPGKHSLNSWIYVPNSDNYDYEKFEIDKFAEETIEFWRKYAPNLTKENILAVGSQTPLDIYNRNPNMMFGDWIVGDYIPEQILMNRPIREFGKHRTTIQNLYLCGPSTNPAATIQFSNGYLAFLAIAEDYNIPQWWYDYKTKGYLYQFPYPVTVPDKTRP